MMSILESQPEALERQPGPDQRVEQRLAALVGLEFRDAGTTGDGSMTLAGHAAVFDRLSLPLYDWQYGEFQERISRGAFDNVLNGNPDVHLVVGHDMTRVLARTQSKTLELREDPAGLRVFARIDPGISFANDLRIQMQRGDVDQMSFAFTVARDEWLIENPDTPEERVIRTIREIDQLFDVSVVAQGAYPQTDANLRSLFEVAAQRGRVFVSAQSLPTRQERTALTDPDPDDPGETFGSDIAEAIEALSDLLADGYDLSMSANEDAGSTVAEEIAECIGYLSDLLSPEPAGSADSTITPRRLTPKVKGGLSSRTGPKPAGTDVRKRRAEQMRQRLALIQQD